MVREEFEVPGIFELGSVVGMTLGSGGSCCDGNNGRDKKLLGNDVCDNGRDDDHDGKFDCPL